MELDRGNEDVGAAELAMNWPKYVSDSVLLITGL